MSVIASKRSESKLQYLVTAKNLQEYLLVKSKKWPKRFSFTLTQQILNLATNAHIKVKMAHSKYPQNDYERQLKKDCLNDAYESLQALVSQVDIAKTLYEIEERHMIKIMEMIDEEMRLIKGVLKNSK